MTLYESLSTFLAGIVTKIYPTAPPSEPVVPYGLLRRISGTEAANLDGTSQVNHVRLELTIYCNTTLEAEQKISVVRGRFRGFNSYLGGSPNARFTTTGFAGPRDAYDPSTRLRGMQLDILGLLDEDTIS